MKSADFIKKCVEIFGYGYQTKAAKALGISRKTVNLYAKGKTIKGKKATIKQETVDKLMELWNEYERNKAKN